MPIGRIKLKAVVQWEEHQQKNPEVIQFLELILVVGLLARSQYLEGPATGHIGTGLSWFPCVYKRMLRWFPTLPVATACFSCSPPDLNFLDPYFVFMFSLFHVYVHAL